MKLKSIHNHAYHTKQNKNHLKIDIKNYSIVSVINQHHLKILFKYKYAIPYFQGLSAWIST